MTLRRQLFICITLLFALLLAGSLLINLKNAREHLKDQLRLHAQETATSLAFSISTATRDGQQALMNSMADVIFDSGYYLSISLVNTHGETQLLRERSIKVEGVPDWFVRLSRLPAAEGKAGVVSGWRQLGTLRVVSNPGLAYRDLWRVFCEQSVLFALLGVAVNLLAALALRVLLKPLHAVERQAEAICRQEFVELEALPRTRELRQVVQAMNRMARKLKQIFAEQLELIESLRLQSYIDPVTRLSNRSDFDARLRAVIERGDKRSGVLVLFQINHFNEFNQQYGRAEGDACLQALAEKLAQAFAECSDVIVARRSGTDFAVYLPGFPLERARVLTAQVMSGVASAGFLRDAGLHAGMAHTPSITRPEILLTQADHALRQAQARNNFDMQLYQEDNLVDAARQAHQWFTLLQRVLQQQLVTLHGQPLFNRQRQRIAIELLCRVEDGSQLMNAGVFFPMVERFGLASEFDKLILSQASRFPSEDVQQLCLNVSPQTLTQTGCVNWIVEALRREPALAKQLVLEMPAHVVARSEAVLRELAERLRPLGTRLALDHFGLHSTAFAYLHSLPLAYLKIDRTFIKDIHKSADNQFFVKSLVQIAHSRDIAVYAEGVETEAEWLCVLELGLDGAQGYYLGRPA